MSVLICDGIRLAYGVDVVLENISFSVNSADKLGIIGVNGAGKSTLFSIILGRCEPTSGNVYIKNGFIRIRYALKRGMPYFYIYALPYLLTNT